MELAYLSQLLLDVEADEGGLRSAEEAVTRCKLSHRYLTSEFGVSTADDRY